MKKEITFTAKQVGERVKERRTELNLTMPEPVSYTHLDVYKRQPAARLKEGEAGLRFLEKTMLRCIGVNEI